MKPIFLFFFLSCITLLWGISDTSEQYSRIPIRSLPFLSKQKFIEIEIEEVPYLALIDTGSARSFIRKDILDRITTKNHISNSDVINIYGKKYLTSNFRIPAVKIGDFSAELIFKEEAENFLKDCTVSSHPLISWKTRLLSQFFREAIIGFDLFQQFACIFDFPHSSIFIANEFSSLMKNIEFSTSDFYSAKFEIGKAGVLLTFETDLGSKRLLLDAGSTISILRCSDEEKEFLTGEQFTTNSLNIKGLEFGKWKFYIMDIAKEMDDLDGILGIEFFNKNIIGFDFSTQTAYIQSPKLGSKERFNYWIKSCFGK